MAYRFVTNHVRWMVLLVFCLITFFVNNSVLLPDIMEARNIVTAREMVYDGNWVVPTMNGELRFEKPPLPTWIAAVGEILAPDSLGLQRGLAGLAALLLVFYFYRFVKRFLGIDPFVSTLILCTCYNVILMGRTASWDVYCHAFMMGGIYHLAAAMTEIDRKWKHGIMSGILVGLSLMSKGPVSVYALLLPFVIVFALVFRGRIKICWTVISVMCMIALVVGGWWFVFIHLSYPNELAEVVEKESTAWISYNVRPWYYYWKFFLESGVWIVLLLTAIVLPVWKRQLRQNKWYLLPLLWMLVALVLLSLLPEKKMRYVFPLLIPASMLMGYLLDWWKKYFVSGAVERADCLIFRLNVWLVVIAVMLLPIFGWVFMLSVGKMTFGLWLIMTCTCFVVALVLIWAGLRLRIQYLVYAVAILFMVSEVILFPSLKSIINNPEMKSIASVREIEILHDLPFYHDASEPLRIELVYAAHRKIRPIEMDTTSLKEHSPMVLLTHEPIEEVLDEDVIKRVDIEHVGVYDDNPRPRSNKRYGKDFIYHVNILNYRAK